MNYFLLQIEPATSLFARLGDQLFSIALLVTVTYVLWNKITKLQDKMDSYLDADRKVMMEVIAKNTEVIEKLLSQK
jgi:hypothetical protein